ncbi:unnamed protein product [Symbiodinium sp. CCMP2456]|nr:unnamed protein product [Symbiodinium sp. CCMP2456]
MEDPAEWLRREGASVVDDLLTKGPPKDHDVILKVTLEEIQKGFCSPLMSRAEVDKRFGRGRWRPLERFVITQPDGKQRVIDNARKTGHNAHTYMLETIHTVSVDFVASCVRDVFRTLFPNCSDAVPPPCDWMAVRLGTDDLPDAYRGHPVDDDQLRFSVVSIWIPGSGWNFTILWGVAYGLEAAVVAFNRMPLLGIAACRRMVSAFTAAYFDDELSLEFIRDADVSQGGLHLVFSLMGSPPQPSKRFWASADRCYLGTSVHVGSANSLGVVRVQPKISSVQKVCAKLDAALESASLSRDEAGKLRGDLQWLFASCNGSAARFAAPVLQRCQYGDNPRRDLLWFIDNQAAVAAAVKTASAEEDVFEIAHMAALLRARLQCRCWFEWIDSDSNPSDGLSRDGLLDTWSLSQTWFLESHNFPAAAYRSQIRADLLKG